MSSSVTLSSVVTLRLICGGWLGTKLKLLTVILVGQGTQAAADNNHVTLILAHHMGRTLAVFK